MNSPPIVRFSSLAAGPLAMMLLALVGAGGGCSVDKAGISDPGSGGPTRGGLGGATTDIMTGTGGKTAGGAVGGTSGATTGGSGGASGGGADASSDGGAGGSDGTGTGATGGAGGTTVTGGTGGSVSGAGGAANGAGGAAGTGAGGKPDGGMVGMPGGGMGGMPAGGGVGGMPAGGMGGSPVVAGCADATREAFTNVRTFPSIAGCAGGWSTPGVVTTASMTATCARAGGNNGTKPDGAGCTVEDLCAAGWHVCRGATELAALGVSCDDAGLPTTNGPAGAMLFVTRQRGLTGTTCLANALVGANNIHGCGNFGLAEDQNCSPLNRQFSHTECDMAPPWFCDDGNNQDDEAQVVTKMGSAAGGVLCCH